MAIKIYRIPSWDLAFECKPEELTMVLMDYARNDWHHARNLCLSGFDLSGIDLEGLDLSGTNFYRANLSNANLKSTRLSGTCFSHATLDGTDLCHARGIGEADFLGATMHHVRVYDQKSKKTRTLVCDPMHISGLGLPVLVLDDMLAVISCISQIGKNLSRKRRMTPPPGKSYGQIWCTAVPAVPCD